jgi:MarR family transcriptional regulator, temperature-dependent positive regulator of motility
MNNSLPNTFFHLVRELLQEHSALWKKALPNLSKQQFSILTTVFEKPGIEQVELMTAALTSKAALAEILQRMEEKGLLERRSSLNDKRRRFIFLTEQGKNRYQVSRSIADNIDNLYLKRVEQDDYQHALLVLKQMINKKSRSPE